MKPNRTAPLEAPRREDDNSIRNRGPRACAPCISFRPARARRDKVIAVGRKGDRFRVNLTPELLWQTLDYPIEIRREASKV